MREQIMQVVVGVLNNNVGNRLTNELASGIALVLNQALVEMESKPPEVVESANE